VWILAQDTAAPNLSAFVEVNIGSKSTSSIGPFDINRSDSGRAVTMEDWSTMLRRAGLGNAETATVIQCIKNKRLRVAGVDCSGDEKRLVLVSGVENSEDLLDDGFDSPIRGAVYR
jgi:hypothetical protein